MKGILIFAFACLLTDPSTASAQNVEPGTITFTAGSSPMAGGYEAHPGVILKSGEVCDLLQLRCMAKARREFGESIFVKRDALVRSLLDSIDLEDAR